MRCQDQAVDEATTDEIVDAIEQLIGIARTIDFDIRHSRPEGVANLMIQGRYFAALTANLDPFDASAVITERIRQRRRLDEAPGPRPDDA